MFINQSIAMSHSSISSALFRADLVLNIHQRFTVRPNNPY